MNNTEDESKSSGIKLDLTGAQITGDFKITRGGITVSIKGSSFTLKGIYSDEETTWLMFVSLGDAPRKYWRTDDPGCFDERLFEVTFTVAVNKETKNLSKDRIVITHYSPVGESPLNAIFQDVTVDDIDTISLNIPQIYTCN